MKKIVATALIMLSLTAYAAESGKQVAAKFNDFTVSYILPKTVIDIEVELELTQLKAGPYANYSQKYLGIPAKVTDDSRRWRLVSANAKVSSIPDKEASYSVQLKSGATPYVYINEEGVLLAVNAEPIIENNNVVEEQESELTSSPLDDESYSYALTEEMLLSGSNIKMAELAAKQIYRIRESRTDIITGESDQQFDGEALKIMMQQLDEQEDRLTVMFTGTKQTQRKTIKIRWIPEGACEDVVVARVSEKDGLVDRDNLSGEPIYISLNNVKRATYPLDSKGLPFVLPENSIIYNIPGEAQLSLTYQGENIFGKKVDLTQFGVKFGLAPKLFVDKKTQTYMVLHPTTGAIKEIGQKVLSE